MVYLDKEQRRELQVTFRDIHANRLSSDQARLLKDHNIDFGYHKNGRFYFGYNGQKIYHAIKTHDWRSGRNLARDLIRLVETN